MEDQKNDPEEFMIKRITQEEAETLLDSSTSGNDYKPIGCFWLKEGNRYIAIDNSTGCAWTEDFKTRQGAIRFLEGLRCRDAHGVWHNT